MANVELDRTSSQYTKYRIGLGADQEIAFLFEPDTLLSAQYFENFRRKTLLEPEKSLMLGVLDDAVNCFQENLLAKSGRGRKLFDEAEEWILDEARDCIFRLRTSVRFWDQWRIPASWFGALEGKEAIEGAEVTEKLQSKYPGQTEDL